MLALHWASGQSAAAKPTRILVVDDEPSIVRSLRRAFSRLRPAWQVDVAQSGAVALRHLSCADYDAVVTDLEMPGISGFELLGRVQEQYPEVKRLIHSSRPQAENDASTGDAAQAVFTKPAPPIALVERIERLLGLQPSVSVQTST